MLTLLLLIGVMLAPSSPSSAAPPDLAGQAYQILREHCFQCHGKDPQKIKGKLKILDHAGLLANPNGVLVPGKPDDSQLLQMIIRQEMPKGTRKKVPAEEIQILRDWIAAGATVFPDKPPGPSRSALLLASDVKRIFKARCYECHGGIKTNLDLRIMDRDALVKDEKIIPGNPSDSLLVTLITAKAKPVMPPEGQPPLTNDEIDVVRNWIAGGAIPFPADVAMPVNGQTAQEIKAKGVPYILESILKDVRKLPKEDRRYVRYFSLTHILIAGATEDQLADHRNALAKAINHLSWEKNLVRPRPIEPTETILAVDLRKLGWDKEPFRQVKDGKVGDRIRINLFDLALLEYPYGIAYPESHKDGLFNQIIDEYLALSGPIRPISFIRSDWFVSVATQPPLYEDFLQLPRDLRELEQLLGVDAQNNIDNGHAVRAGLAISGVSRNNRVAERHKTKHGSYWKSYDFSSSKGPENLFRDPVHLHPAGGEMIFSLPNGLQGYFIVDRQGNRLDSAPTDIVVDIHASDKIIRNGLACMRCHDKGVKEVADGVRATLRQRDDSSFDRNLALQLYPAQADLDRFLREDSTRFTSALARLFDDNIPREPLTRVTKEYLDDPLSTTSASAELGLNESGPELFRSSRYANLGLAALGAAEGRVRRDMWEDAYDQAVRQAGAGIPIVSLDAITRRNYEPIPPPFELELRTNKKVFAPGDELVIFVKADKDVFIEMVATSAQGNQILLLPSSTQLKRGDELRYPEEGAIKIQGGKGKEMITVYASDAPFRNGVLVRAPGVADRFLHALSLVRNDQGRLVNTDPDPTRMVKKTILIETQ